MIMIEILKYSFIVINSIYVFTKLIGKNITKNMFLCGIPSSLIIAFGAKLTREYIPALTVIFLIVSIICFASFFYRTSIQTCTVVAAISVASVYGLYTVLALVLVTCLFLLYIPLSQHHLIDGITNIILGVFELFLSWLLFRTKHFRNGIPSLKQRGSNTTGVFISIAILFLSSLATPNMQANWRWLIPVFILLTCSCFLYLWWRVKIKKDYIQRVREREIAMKEDELNEKEKEIQKLNTHNEMLAAIIHRDNKLIPAMESAVRDCLSMILEDAGTDKITEKAKILLAQLQEMTRERTGIITQYESQGSRLAATNVPSVDILLSYLYRKAEKQNAVFTFSFSGNVREFANSYIDETNLQTVLADLVENAINATQSCVKRAVHVDMSVGSDIPEIYVYDSGIPFTPEVLEQMGLRRVTTRKEENGSGIGLMSTFTILHKYKASFELEELDGGEAYTHTYTKRISLCFDKLNEYRIRLPQNEEIMNMSKRIDLVMIP